jgi:peptide/nickel transport system substrate-binding protein
MHKRLLGLLATSVIVFAACGTGATNAPPASGPAATQAPPATPTPEVVLLDNSKYAPVDGKSGGTVIFSDWQEALNFNPFYTTGVTEVNVGSAVFAGLVVGTNDYKYLPDLATSIPTVANGGVVVPGGSGDAMTVTWKLKPDEKWSDGQPLTCADFEYTRSWVMDPGNTALSGGTVGYEDMSKIECPDPTTIVEHFKNIYEGYIGLSTPLPQHYLKDIPIADQVKNVGFKAADMPKVPTSGAFKFESVTTGQELRLIRNDYYKGFKSGKPAYLDRLIFKWYGSSDAMIAGYVAGETDVITNMVVSDLPTLTKDGVQDQVSNIPSLTYETLSLNWADGSKVDPVSGFGHCSPNPAVQDRGTGCPVADPQFRLALNSAINKDDINTRLLNGGVQIANSDVAPDAYFYVPTPAAKFDPEKAKSILDAAGWVVGSDGIRAKAGLRAKIELCSTTKQVRIDTLKLIAEELKAVGIEAIPNNQVSTLVFAPFSTATKDTACNIYHGNYDVAEFGSAVSVDPIAYYSSYHSSQFEPKGGNQASVSDPDIDKALDAVKTTVDLTKVKAAMATFQQVYASKVVEVPLYYRPEIEVVNPKLGNFFANPTSQGPTWNVVDWYLK